MRRKNYYNAKKKKFAVYQTALTALFIALAVVLNAAFYAIAEHFRWYIDMTEGPFRSRTRTELSPMGDT